MDGTNQVELKYSETHLSINVIVRTDLPESERRHSDLQFLVLSC